MNIFFSVYIETWKSYFSYTKKTRWKKVPDFSATPKEKKGRGACNQLSLPGIFIHHILIISED